MLRIKASFAMSEGKSSRGIRSGLSKSAERIRTGDESGKTAQPTFAAHGIATESKTALSCEFPD